MLHLSEVYKQCWVFMDIYLVMVHKQMRRDPPVKIMVIFWCIRKAMEGKVPSTVPVS